MTIKRALKIAGLVLAMGVVALWASRGANLGWTKTSVAHKKIDPVTEIEVDVYVERFVPGVDFLAAGLALAGVVAASSLFFKPRPAKQ